MPNTYRVTLRDGREFDVETDGAPPSEQAIMAYVAQHMATPATSSHGQTAASAEAFTAQSPSPESSARTRFASNVVRGLNPLPMLKYAVPGFGAKWMAEDIGRGVTTEAAKARDAQSVPEAIGHGAATALPLVGPAAANIGEQIGSGDVAGGLGSVAALAVGAPMLKATTLGLRGIGKAARPLARSALKPTVTSMKHQAGASMTGINAPADQLVDFVVRNRMTTPEQAEAFIAAREADLGNLVGNQPTIAPRLAAHRLEQQAARPNVPTEVSEAFSRARRDLVNDPLGETVMVDQPAISPILDASGRPFQTTTQVPTRQLRQTVPAREALDMARQRSKWGNKKTWGETKGVEREIDKTIEKAERDALKLSVPGAKTVLRQQGQAIRAKEALDRMNFREANRDVIGLPEHVIAAGEFAAGKVPWKTLLAGWWKRNQLKNAMRAEDIGDLERGLSNPDMVRLAIINAMLEQTDR